MEFFLEQKLQWLVAMPRPSVKTTFESDFVPIQHGQVNEVEVVKLPPLHEQIILPQTPATKEFARFFPDYFATISGISEKLVLKRVHENGLHFSISSKYDITTIEYSDLPALHRAYLELACRQDEEDIQRKLEFKKLTLQIDCTQNGKYNLEFLEKMVATAALLGYNSILLYTPIPFDDSEWDSLTEREIRAIVSYSNKFSIEVIPQTNLLSHVDEILPENYLKGKVLNGPRVVFDLRMGDKELSNIIRDLLSKTIPLFKNGHKPLRMFVGCDEVETLQKDFGNKAQKKFDEHIVRIKNICKEFNVEPMFWADAFVMLKSSIHDVNFVLWEYDITNTQKLWSVFQKYTKENYIPVTVAAGTQLWVQRFASYERAIQNIDAYMHFLGKNKLELLITTWHDEGTAANLQMALPSIAYAASRAWGVHKSDAAQIGTQVLTNSGSYEFYILMSHLNFLDEKFNENDLPPNMAHTLMFAKPFTRFQYNKYPEEKLIKWIESHFTTLYYDFLYDKELPKGDTQKSYDFALEACRFLQKRGLWGNKVYRAYKNNDKKELKRLAYEAYALANDLRDVCIVDKKLTLTEKKRGSFAIIEKRYNRTQNEFVQAARKIMRYISGDEDQVDEIEHAALRNLNRRYTSNQLDCM